MAGLVAAVSLEGCGLFTKSYDFTEAENSIYVEDNATIRAAMISDFDKDYYSIDELAGVAQQEALSFNKNVYGCSYYSYDQMTKEEKESILLPVCYEKAVVKDKKASVVFTYANGDTYTGFNSAEIQNAGGSKLYTSQLGSSTMALSGDFVTSDGQKHISSEDLMKKTDYCLVYADYPVTYLVSMILHMFPQMLQFWHQTVPRSLAMTVGISFSSSHSEQSAIFRFANSNFIKSFLEEERLWKRH